MTWPPTSRGAATSDTTPSPPERAGQRAVGHLVHDHGLGPLGHGPDHAFADPDGHPGGRLGRAPRGPHGQALAVVGHQEDGGRLAPHHPARPGQQLLQQGVEGQEGQGRVGDRLDGAQGAGGVARAPAGSAARPPAERPG